MDLSLLIPARNEQFLRRTVEDALAHLRGETEILVVLDGAWADPPLEQHPRVHIVHCPESIGQRAATNLAARISQARYIMKVDAHCAFDEGFDIKLLADMQPTWTMIPRMYNLHVFDWVCNACQARTYQGPQPPACKTCGGTAHHQDVVWTPRWNRVSDFARFDNTLHFQYWGAYKNRPDAQGDIADTLCHVGACWLMERERFWELGGLDEAHGSWGQMGVEISCKTWLSGGRQVVNKRTWFAHMFRTQPGFGFPYPLSGNEVAHARTYSRDLWVGGTWPKAKHSLRWLLDKFAPVPDWDEKAMTPIKAPAVHTATTTGVLFYTDSQLDEPLASAVRSHLQKVVNGSPIVSVSLQPLAFGTNITLPLERGYLTMFKQILVGLEALDTDVVFFAEHDVLYHASHFAFQVPDAAHYFYNVHFWKIGLAEGRAVSYRAKQTSGLVANRRLLLAHYRTRVARVEAEGFSRKMGFEPGSHHRTERVDDVSAVEWRSAVANLDIRHRQNLTPTRWSPEQFRDRRNCAEWKEADTIPGWGRVTSLTAMLQRKG